MRFHLAQVNIARMRGSVRDAVMAEMVALVDETNRLAEASDGFVWRAGVVGDAELEVFRGYFEPFDAARLFYNMSVWTSVEALRAFVFGAEHVKLLRRQREWMEHLDRASLAIWWIAAGERPTVAESALRLRRVHESGPTAEAFTLREPYLNPTDEPQDTSGVQR